TIAPSGRTKYARPKVPHVTSICAVGSSIGKNTSAIVTAKKPKTTKSNHSSTLPTIAATIVRRSDGCAEPGCPLVVSIAIAPPCSLASRFDPVPMSQKLGGKGRQRQPKSVFGDRVAEWRRNSGRIGEQGKLDRDLAVIGVGEGDRIIAGEAGVAEARRQPVAAGLTHRTIEPI